MGIVLMLLGLVVLFILVFTGVRVWYDKLEQTRKPVERKEREVGKTGGKDEEV